MTETLKDKVRRQLELEDESRGLGRARYRSKRPLPWRTEAGSVEEEADLPPGRQLLKLVIVPTAEAIREWVARIEGGGAGRRHTALRILAAAGPEEVAYLTGRVVMNSAVSQLTLTATAFAVAASIIEHVEMLNLKEVNKEGFKGLIKSQKKTGASGKRRAALRKIMNAEGTRLMVPQGEQLQVGLKAIELLCEATDLFTMEFTKSHYKKSCVRPTEAVMVWLERQHGRCELLEPIHMPMVVRPRRWRTPFWGGYLTKRPGLRLVKQWTDTYHSELRHVHMPDVYNAVNAVQETPWRINTRVLDVMTQVWDEGGSLGGLPRRDDIELPGKPVDFEENDTARVDWLRAAARVHADNARALSKRLAFQQRLWIASKFREEEEIFFPHELDFRGRIYPIPTGGPHPQADDSGKALLEFADAAPLGADGVWWLAVHIANLFGVDKVKFQERVDWTFAHTNELLDSARNPLDGERFWTTADSPYCALAASMEWLGYFEEGEEYLSHLPVALDGSNSGLQHFSAMLRDPVGARAVNLLPSEKPQDVYKQVAERTQEIVDLDDTITVTRRDKEGKETTLVLPNPWLGGKVSRKLAKRPTMTYCYSATRYGMVDMIHQTLKELDAEAGAPYLEGADNYTAASYLSYAMWAAIEQTVVAASEAMGRLREVAKLASKAEIPIWWTSPAGLPILQMYQSTEGKHVEVFIAGKSRKLVIQRRTNTLNPAAQANAIAPNFVHSFDAGHLMAVANACRGEGIMHLAVIHDSFGTHAANAGALSELLRETFIEQYTPNVLERFREEVLAQLPEAQAALMPPMPAMGDMQMSDMAQASYMFA